MSRAVNGEFGYSEFYGCTAGAQEAPGNEAGIYWAHLSAVKVGGGSWRAGLIGMTHTHDSELPTKPEKATELKTLHALRIPKDADELRVPRPGLLSSEIASHLRPTPPLATTNFCAPPQVGDKKRGLQLGGWGLGIIRDSLQGPI